ncbi:hypothetical protein HNY73_018993 [Argiope bruennichi]|uniref:Uncharacterized protein n=1 Tax=Argiope bruennichi TaxID=94029 RepID=A0A8T0EFV7_ARGBR|nr:hypothetical protein HNY73_018993 [Argiope bruennichi]
MNVQINRKTVTAHRNFWNFKKSNWDRFRQLIERAVDNGTFTDDLGKEWRNFKQAIIRASHQCIPRSNFKHLKSFFKHRDPDLSALILRKKALHRKFSQICDMGDKVEINRFIAVIKQSYMHLMGKYLCNNIDARTPNSKLWRLAQSLTYTASQADKTTANLLGNFYKNMSNLVFDQNDVAVKDKSKRLIHNCCASRSGGPILIKGFSLREHNFVLRVMDIRKSPGPDSIHGFTISHFGTFSVQRLLNLLNPSWKLGHLPREWKRATVAPF